jgi:hypothetical protein
MHHTSIARLPRTAFLLALLTLAAGACGRDGSDDGRTVLEADVVGWRPATRSEFMAMPGSARLDVPTNDGSFGSGRGVAVEVTIRIDGMQGKGVPFAYSLYDARNDLHFVSTTIPLVPDAPQWSRRGFVWLPVPAPGSYYVGIALNDSTGRKTDGPRTQDFTIE